MGHPTRVAAAAHRVPGSVGGTFAGGTWQEFATVSGRTIQVSCEQADVPGLTSRRA
ncbi:hypothetical protein [Mycobacterium attenuatum]|uniref:hypothetical protein n=1 Tax=Mycobacterium attenuatum TaxID=2341086 RepID=UPI00145A0280|nr:hypothetical protein [Mycobacterium attenuatum]